MILKLTLVSCIPALALSAAMMHAAWNHNSQGEIHINGVIDWEYWLLIGLSWFLPVFIVTSLILTLLLKMRKS